jgi:hypothetical protein
MGKILLLALKFSPGLIWFRFFGEVALASYRDGRTGVALFILVAGVGGYLYLVRAAKNALLCSLGLRQSS